MSVTRLPLYRLLLVVASTVTCLDAQTAGQILTESCAGCHGGKEPAGKLSLESLAKAAAGGASGPAVLPGDAARSPLYQRIVTDDRALRMPPAGGPLPADKVEIIRQWIHSGAPGLAPATAPVEFAKHVAPVLEKNCYSCHSGPQPKGQLRLDVPAGVVKGGIGGPAVVAGKPAESRLLHRIEGKGGERQMPLGGAPLSAAEIATIRSWIEQGAKLPAGAERGGELVEKHWSYRKPVKPAVPKVSNASAVRTPVDAFLLAKLEERGLAFSPQASKETLIRRLRLDLIGLPPTPAEVESFVGDNRPDAYERLVDRLLASPHYGERWARHWLDLARYADTHGYEKDERRTMWKFRDWVIDAFNRDMPYDRFTIEQIAGDLLPGGADAQKIATGFHRNTMLNEEGGVDKDETYFEVLTDRVNTTATVWLGSTLACSQCHNHKYDPFTQKDYYAMMAFFSNNTKKAVPHGTGEKYLEPQLDLATPEQETQRARIKARIEELEEQLKTHTPDLEQEQRGWEAALREARKQWTVLQPKSLQSLAGSVLKAQAEGVIAASGDNPQRETYTVEGPAGVRKLSGLRIETLPDASLPRGGPGRDVYGHFVITEVILEVGNGEQWQPVRFRRIVADDGRVMAKGTRQLWTIDASREEKRLPRQLVLVPEEPVEIPEGARVRVRIVQDSDFIGQTVGRLRLSLTSSDDPVLITKLRPSLLSVIDQPEEQRSAKDRKELAEFFRSVAASLEPARDELKDRKNELDKLGIVSAMVMQEQPGVDHPFDFVRTRGAFSSKTDKVYAAVPAVLGTLPPGEKPNRLGLARWLVSPENPLTARVAVNRIWEHYFGRGIVETSEDFGTQGERPSNQELLDWLAVEFMENGWSFRKLHRTIVTSTAYRQSSRMTPELLQSDPYNQLISRGPRFRMEAEMIRDNALAASGLLSRKMGGPSVYPPQPDGVWDIPYSDEKWETSQGEDRYRRGIYTFLRRSAPYPAMMNFDAVSREFCTVRRIRTNSPAAALTTLNDPAFFEMAQALARRVEAEGGSDDRSRVDYAFRLVNARRPAAAERDHLLSWLSRERSYFKGHPDEAASLGAGKAERAPWTMLANVLLNLDEALTKE